DGSGASPGDDYECSDDWLAHEWTHAYTQHTCNLTHNSESGALNEAFSDIFAAFITGDWLVFEDAWLKASAPAWRNMIDPTNGGQWNTPPPENNTLAGHPPAHGGPVDPRRPGKQPAGRPPAQPLHRALHRHLGQRRRPREQRDHQPP